MNTIIKTAIALSAIFLVGCGGGYDAALQRYDTALATVERIQKQLDEMDAEQNVLGSQILEEKYKQRDDAAYKELDDAYKKFTAVCKEETLPLRIDLTRALERLEEARAQLDSYR